MNHDLDSNKINLLDPTWTRAALNWAVVGQSRRHTTVLSGHSNPEGGASKLMSDLILAIDPGKTSGFAYNGRAWQAAHDPYQFEMELIRHRPKLIVYESFVHTQRSGIDYTPVEMIGVIKLYGAKYQIQLYPQTPSDGKKFFDNNKLKKLGLYAASKPHAMDALRHLLRYMMKNDMLDLRLLK